MGEKGDSKGSNVISETGSSDASDHFGPAEDETNSHSTSQSAPLSPRYDKLTVFQAAPLVWKDDDDNLHAVEMLDFDREREILTESMREAHTKGNEVVLEFETANTERLGAFLAASETQVLHFTCHGIPNYLAIEDGTGGAQFLSADDLRDFMSAGGGKLLFVFVSACYSRAAGEAFLEAGVPHVVCCQHDEPLMDLAAQEFSRNFYLALACGMNLRRSFELGKKGVNVCPQIPKEETGKFLLLPEDGDHDVPIFFTKPQSRGYVGVKPSYSSRILPPPPEVFVGREMEMYEVLQNLQHSRLVRLKGCPGSGKAGVAASVARYVSARERTCSLFDQVFWLPLIYAARRDELSSSFNELFAILQDDRLAFGLHQREDYSRAFGTTLEILHQSKALLVIDAKGFVDMQSITKLSIFLQDLFQGTSHVRVLLIEHDIDISVGSNVVESDVAIEPLDFESTATLFGRLCPFVSDRPRCRRVRTPRQLSNILVPEDKGDVKLLTQRSALSKRCVDIFKMMGEGIPSNIHLCARAMTPEEYDCLIEKGEQIEYNSDCKTRVECEVQLQKLGEDQQAAAHGKDFKKAKEIQDALDELERHRDTLPELSELRHMASNLEGDLDKSVQQKKFTIAEKLSDQLDLLNKKIEMECEALLKYGLKETNDAECDPDSVSTRGKLESEILKLQTELENAVKRRDFSTCQRIQERIDKYCTRRKSLPFEEQLSAKILALNDDLQNAVVAHEFERAGSIDRQIKDLEGRVPLEKESEEEYVATTAAQLGRELSNMAESLQEAVNARDLARAKEKIESIFRWELRGLEYRFGSRYSSVNEKKVNSNESDSDQEEDNQRRPHSRRRGDDRDEKAGFKRAPSPEGIPVFLSAEPEEEAHGRIIRGQSQPSPEGGDELLGQEAEAGHRSRNERDKRRTPTYASVPSEDGAGAGAFPVDRISSYGQSDVSIITDVEALSHDSGGYYDNGSNALRENAVVAARVDAVTEKAAIEKIVLDAINNMQDPQKDPVGKQKKKSSIIKNVLKFGKRKKDS